MIAYVRSAARSSIGSPNRVRFLEYNCECVGYTQGFTLNSVDLYWNMPGTVLVYVSVHTGLVHTREGTVMCD